MKNESQESEGTEKLEIVEVSALEVTERASIDVQITTAKKYPRSLQAFKKRAIDMALIDEETAESCIYRRPVGMKNGEQQYAEGMSVRMAEIVGASYGNLRVKAFMVEQTERMVRACGQAIDLETNFASSSEIVESTVDKQGKPYSERQRLLIAKVALAKARRDATFQVVPRALARPVEAAVRNLLMGNSETLTKRRDKVISWINKLGIDAKRVYAALKIAGEAELGAEQLETLTGIRTAIKDNETTIDEAFPKDETPRKPLFTAPPSGTDESKADPAKDKKAPTPEEQKQAAAARDTLISEMKEKMLDAEVTETKLWKYAVDGKHVPDGIEELFTLPTAVLAKLMLAIPALSTKAK